MSTWKKIVLAQILLLLGGMNASKILYSVVFFISICQGSSAQAETLGDKVGRTSEFREFTAEFLQPENPSYPYDLQNNKPHTFYADTYTVIVHADPIWDPEGQTKQGLTRMMNFSSMQGISTIGVIGTEGQQLYKPEDVDFKMASGGGQHRLTFPNARTFIAGGGHLGYCLCESLGDAVKGTTASSDPVNIILVTDAIYEARPALYAANFPSFQVPQQLIPENEWDLQKKVTLEQIVDLNEKHPNLLTDFLDTIVMGGDTKLFCNVQNTYNFKTLHLDDLEISVYNRGKLLKTYG